jgi:hypothetical protein
LVASPQRRRHHNNNGVKMLSTLLPLALALFPHADAACVHNTNAKTSSAKVHSMPLKKLPQSAAGSVLADRAHEAASLARKYGGSVQAPFVPGPNFYSPLRKNDDDGLFWTQEIKGSGGHNVPLDSESLCATVVVTQLSDWWCRFHDCSVLYGD